MRQLEILMDKYKIRQFLFCLENPTGDVKSYGATREINSWDDIEGWMKRWWRDSINTPLNRKRLKNAVMEAIHEQEKEYLEKYAHKLTEEHYGATNS